MLVEHNINEINEYNSDDDMGEDKFPLPIELEFPDNLTNTRNDNDVDKEIIFKNYIPSDKSFRVETITYFNTITDIEKNYDKKVRKRVKDFINLEKNPLSIVPKKNNIDLKKALTSKLEKLNKRTEIAILEIISNIILTKRIGLRRSRTET
jgi:hypothetical protein